MSAPPSQPRVLGVIAAGGVLGALARYGLAVALPHQPDAFPWATFLTNASGCLLLGALMVLLLDWWPPRPYVRPFLGVGVLGGYTTFSTYAAETRALVAAGAPATAAGYALGSLAAALVAVWAGMTLTRAAVSRLRRRGARRPA
ncbi:fluoride efflux transporter CrcB [Carbonactinospora thermoautotrophica]|uniref:fluoride efflux transporter CrcB n=1 Tax=Carbonactinospora thermoautotrophica TaxID=1469144 RepID=UPI0022716E46|nr:fluoride efflux transporter CrcB [Carbonactinospora thermoautotrophica]MCX9193586.1 fluoride efflux transporter CrcB [Carbonactinospora thermoautotrophica]